jgi:hypothetical protein
MSFLLLPFDFGATLGIRFGGMRLDGVVLSNSWSMKIKLICHVSHAEKGQMVGSLKV